MSEKDIIRQDLAAFEEFLARHGTDRTRWPAHERLAFASLLATSHEAKRLFREAELLDRLLDLAPGTPSVAEKERLASRILDAAFTDAPTPQHWTSAPGARQAAREQPSDVEPGAHVAAVNAQLPAHPRSLSRPRRPELATAAVLAASLLLGLVGGYSGTFDSAFEPLIMSEATSDLVPDPANIALDNGAGGLFGEDLL
jgi:hypothetical protein